MSDTMTFEEEVSYGCAPPEVLSALARINSRIAQHKIDDPGEYEQTDIAAHWMSENLRSNWKLSVTVKRVVKEAVEAVVAEVKPDPVAKSPQGVNVAKIEENALPTVVEPPVAVVEKTPVTAKLKAVNPVVSGS